MIKMGQDLEVISPGISPNFKMLLSATMETHLVNGFHDSKMLLTFILLSVINVNSLTANTPTPNLL